MRGDARRKWERLISKQKNSRLTVAEFCRRQGVSDVSFYQWRKKLNGSTADVQQRFVPLSVAAGANVEVAFPCGAVVRIPAGDHESLVQAISALQNGSRAKA